MLPNFLVIGAPRCGTTWIDESLRAHPNVYMPPEKELHFFDKNYHEGIEYYERCFSGWNGEKAVGEATPDYIHGFYATHDRPVAELIARHLPDARLIVSLRNPIDRAYSHYLNVKAKHEHNDGLSFEEKLRKVRGKAEILKEGFYADHLSHYYRLFPRENILVLLYDELSADPVSFLQKIYRFLGVDSDYIPRWSSAHINMAVGAKRLARSKALWYLSRTLSRLDAHHLSERVRRYNSVPLPKMSDETRHLLLSMYTDKNLELQQLTGLDVSHWNRAK